MKTKTKAIRGIEATDVGSNVLNFPGSEAASQARNLAARQLAVRDRLTSIACQGEREAPVAFAMATVLPDGTVEISATGLERDFSLPAAEALDRLSTILRFHAVAPRRKNHMQRGIAMLAPMASVAFMAATYFNEIAWVDSALMLAGQLAVSWLLNRTTNPQSKKSSSG